MAQKYDRLIFRAIAKGARIASPITKANFVEPGGTQIRVGTTADADEALDDQLLVNAFYDAAAALDEKGVSEDGRVAVINPRQYYALIQGASNNGLINRDVQGSSLQSGQGIIEIAGIKIYKSMNVPFSVVYQGDVILGRLAMGADFLNPAACVELYAGTATAPAKFGDEYPANNSTS